MASILDLANPDETKTIHVPLTLRDGSKRPFQVTYYPNKLTMEPVKLRPKDAPADGDDDGDDADDETGKTSLRNATSFADMLEGWELTGPIYNREGVEVVAAGAPVPIAPLVIRCVPTWLTSQVTTGIMAVEFPDPKGSRTSRGR